MFKDALIFLFFVSMLNSSHAQISFTNGGLNGDSCDWNCYPPGWTHCWWHQALGVLANSRPETAVQLSAIEGTTFGVIAAYSPGNFGTLSQKLSCSIRRGHEYEFSFKSASYFVYSPFVVFARGKMQIFLNHDTCSEHQLAYTSAYADTVWGIHTAKFIANDDYSWIQLRALYEGIDTEILLDELSPIKCLNAHDVQITGVKDTTLPIGGGCISLLAQSSINTYDSVYWIKLPSDTFAYNQFSTQVCPEANATYIIAMHDSTSGCEGTWWSFDTVNVRVGPTGLSQGEARQVLSIYPNPATDYVVIDNERVKGDSRTELMLEVTNAVGRQMRQQRVESDSRIPTSIKDYAPGVYTVYLKRNNKLVATGRFVKY